MLQQGKLRFPHSTFHSPCFGNKFKVENEKCTLRPQKVHIKTTESEHQDHWKCTLRLQKAHIKTTRSAHQGYRKCTPRPPEVHTEATESAHQNHRK
eukprot:1150542-Pelagomonas_calceolata.AAC.3